MDRKENGTGEGGAELEGEMAGDVKDAEKVEEGGREWALVG